jgi:hypothetical protein
MAWKELAGGVRYYSISDEIGYLNTVFLEFISKIAPGYYILLLTTFTVLFVLSVMWSIRVKIRMMAGAKYG